MVVRSPTEQRIIEREDLPEDIPGGEIIKRYATPEEIQRIGRERRTVEFQERLSGEAKLLSDRERIKRTLQLSEEEAAALTPEQIAEIDFKRSFRAREGRPPTPAEVEAGIKPPPKPEPREEIAPIEEPEKEQVVIFRERTPGERDVIFVVDPVTGERFHRGTEEFARRTREPTREEIITARAREIALEKAAPIIAPETPFRPEVQEKRAREALESLSPEEKEIIGLEVEDKRLFVSTIEGLKMRELQSSIQKATPISPVTGTISPEAEEAEERFFAVASDSKEFVREVGEGLAEVGLAVGTGAAAGVGLRALRVISKPFARGVAFETAAIFTGITAVETGKAIKEEDLPRAAVTVALAGLAVGGAAKGFRKAAPLEEIRPGVRALKEARVIGGVGRPVGETPKVTIIERIQLGIGKRAEVPKTIIEAQALQFELGLKPTAEAVFVEPTGKFRPRPVRTLRPERGVKVEVIEEIAPIRVVARKAGKELREVEIGGRQPFREVTEVKPFEIIETRAGVPIKTRGIIRTETAVPERITTGLLLERPVLAKGVRGFIKGEKGEVGISRGVVKAGKDLIPKIRGEKITGKVEIFGKAPEGRVVLPTTVPKLEEATKQIITTPEKERERREFRQPTLLKLDTQLERVLIQEPEVIPKRRRVVLQEPAVTVDLKEKAIPITTTIAKTQERIITPIKITRIPKPAPIKGLKPPPRKPPKVKKVEEKSFKVTFMERGRFERDDINRFRTEKQAQRYGAYLADVGPDIGFKTSKTTDPSRKIEISPRVVSFKNRKFKFKKENDFFVEKKRHRLDSFGERVMGPIRIDEGKAIKISDEGPIELLSKGFLKRIEKKGGVL